ncbi:extracellular solute-binding protein [Cohnella sp. REN36]|uniref:extracellular solute-binding protein n=1 Tax=Cohnella sp. REN36 TaxID=2887347 RepID=UPI001D14D601|nr:extracellular solute-binding protein [Cohnella sp. REN36]MCC3377206.1 extracellular solute-binding protein [Cohnella sp. REN36]
MSRPVGRARRAFGSGDFRAKAAMCLLVLLLLFAAGCAKDGIIEDVSNVARLDDVPVKTVVVWHTYSDEENRIFEETVIPAFERANPGIRIEAVRQSSNQEYQAALIARASANKTPDVVRLDYAWIPRFASHGLLEPLDGYPGYAEVAAKTGDRLLELNRIGNRTYGLPLNMNTKAAIYNRALLEASGQKQPPDSLRTLVDVARERHWILGMSGLEMWQSLPYFFALGGKLSDPSFARTDGYLNGEDSVRAAETMASLFREGVLNPNLLNGAGDLWTEIYEGRKVLMMDEGPWYYSILLNVANPKADLTRLTVAAPFPSDGANGPIVGGESLVMTRGAAYKAEAWTFIRWMMRPETQTEMFGAGLIPTNADALAAAKAGGASTTYMDAFLKGIEHAYYRPPLPRWNEIDKRYEEAMEDIFLGTRDVRDILNEASAAIDRVLAEPRGASSGAGTP